MFYKTLKHCGEITGLTNSLCLWAGEWLSVLPYILDDFSFVYTITIPHGCQQYIAQHIVLVYMICDTFPVR